MSIKISNNQLSWSGPWNKESSIKEIYKALKANRAINSLDLSNKKIGDDEAVAIAKMLQKIPNLALRSIFLYDNQIGDTGAKTLADAFKNFHSLHFLYLNQNQIGDVGAIKLAESLKTLSSLTKLALSGNKIGDSGADALAALLKISPSMQSLWLKDNQIRDAGAMLAASLKTNSSLTRLVLDNNEIDNDILQEIKAILKNNKIIQTSTDNDELSVALETKEFINNEFTLVRKANSLDVETLAEWLKNGTGQNLTKLNIVWSKIDDNFTSAMSSECNRQYTSTIDGTTVSLTFTPPQSCEKETLPHEEAINMPLIDNTTALAPVDEQL